MTLESVGPVGESSPPPVNPAGSALTLDDFLEARTRAIMLINGDSNDDEIDALWDAVEIACALLGVRS